MTRSVHPHFLCPNCLKPQSKDAPLSLLLTNLPDAASLNFADAKTLPAPLRRLRQCSECSGTMDLPALVQGRLDYHNWGLRLGALAGASLSAYLMSLPTPPALGLIALAGAAVGLFTWFAAGTIERARIAKYRKSID